MKSVTTEFKMFNKDRKELFLAQRVGVTLPPNYMRYQFNNCFEMETELQKDICDFTKYQIIDYYKSLNNPSVEVFTMINSQLAQYTQWCAEQNLLVDNQNHFLEISLVNIQNECINKRMFNNKIMDRATLLNELEELPNASDKFVILALFEGIRGADFCELYNVNIKDFYLDDNGKRKLKIHVVDTEQYKDIDRSVEREIFVSEKLYNLACESNDEYDYYAISGDSRKVLTMNGDNVIKNHPNSKADVTMYQLGRRIYSRIIRIFDFLGIEKWMSAKSLQESGKIQMINDFCKANGITAKNFVYSDKVKMIEEQYNCFVSKNWFLTKYKDFLIED